jgi:hypothetical protein
MRHLTISKVSTLDNYDSEHGALVLKRHAWMRSGEYLPRYETFTYVDYYILHLLRYPILQEAIKYYELNPREPIVIRQTDGNIILKRDREAALNEARATGSRFMLYPLKLQTRRFHNVTLHDISSWQQQIEVE